MLPSLEGTEVDRERIFRPLKALPHAYIGEDYSTKKSGDKIPIECIDSVSFHSIVVTVKCLLVVLCFTFEILIITNFVSKQL